MKLTEPSTPLCMKRGKRPSSAQKKTSEEIEMERIEKLKHEAELARNASRSSFKKLSSAVEYVPVRSNKPLTCPQEFDFKTDKVLRRRNSSSDLAEQQQQQQPRVKSPTAAKSGMILRSAGRAKPQSRIVNLKPTQPKPFKFAEKAMAAASKPAKAEPFVPVAEMVQKFGTKTPERFHTLPANQRDFKPKQEFERLQPTEPVTPHFASDARLRGPRELSTEEKEEEMMKQIAAHPFKAQPVNTEIMHSRGDYGVPRIPKKELTVPEEFHFHTSERVHEGEAAEADEEEEERAKREFHAQPLNKKIFEKVLGVKEVERKAPTVPESPAITKVRPHAMEADQEDDAPAAEPFKAQPLPDFSQKFEPQLDHHKVTVPEPFQAALKPDPRITREQLLQRQMEEEARAREFRANPLPAYDPALPKVEKKEVTKPVDLELPGDRIHQQMRERIMQQRQKELEEQEREKQFHAKPCVVTKMPAFEPKKSTRPLTEV